MAAWDDFPAPALGSTGFVTQETRNKRRFAGVVQGESDGYEDAYQIMACEGSAKQGGAREAEGVA